MSLRSHLLRTCCVAALAGLLFSPPCFAQGRGETGSNQPASQQAVSAAAQSINFSVDEDTRLAERSVWQYQLSDIADIDSFEITSDKPIRMKNPTGQGAGNPLIIYFMTLTPKKLAPNQKAPLMVFVHGGVHGRFDLIYLHPIKELIQQGYIVVAPDYRGSTGYGAQYYNQIDYGGAEVDDVHTVKDWAVANLPHVDPNRVGIMGWSHGGYITLMTIFRWPHEFKVAYAGCPVSDLVMRMGYKSQGYRDIFAGFIGKQAEDDPMEYRKRSPYFHAAELDTPLLVHTNTNDEDVNVMEVQHLIDSLKANGKQFEYKIYENAPGGHHFNRIDTQLAHQSRAEVYSFLAKYLKPSAAASATPASWLATPAPSPAAPASGAPASASAAPASGSSSAGSSSSDLVALGRARYNAYRCFECHGPNGEGTDDAPDLTATLLDAQQISTFLQKPSPDADVKGMPTIPADSPDLAPLVAYVTSIKRPHS
jgi:acetyl esterase/lipase